MRQPACWLYNLDRTLDEPRSVTVPVESELAVQVNRWLEFHGIEPHDLVRPAVIVRDATLCRVNTRQYVRDECGRIEITWSSGQPVPTAVDVTTQGEAPPLPFPSEPDLEAWRRLPRHAARPAGR